MSEAAAHLVDNVLPEARYRQLVITLPHPLRFWVATNKKLLSKIHGIVRDAIHRNLKEKAKLLGIKSPNVGSITYIQYFGSALQLTPHFHVLVMEKAFYLGNDGTIKNLVLPKMNDTDLQEILQEIIIQSVKYLKKQEYISQEEDIQVIPPMDKLFNENPFVAENLANSLHLPRGEKLKIASGFGFYNDEALKKSKLCFQQNGFSLHGGVKINSRDRKGLERLVSYMARSSLNQDRLSYDGDQVIYQLKKPWSDGRTIIRYSPMGFLSRLTALIPPPRAHLIKHSGIFASSHKLRSQIIPNPEKKKVLQLCPENPDASKKVKTSGWARLLARIFEIDVGTCPKCCEDMVIIGAVFEKKQVNRYLEHVGLLPTGPPQDRVTIEPIYLELIAAE